MPFKRNCKRCEDLFQPTGKYQRYCFECRIKVQWERPKKDKNI